jgi:hypothetical protein
VFKCRKAGFSTTQDCPPADDLAALEMTEKLELPNFLHRLVVALPLTTPEDSC